MTKKEILYIVGLVALYILIDIFLFGLLPDNTLWQILVSLLTILLVGGVGLYLLMKLKDTK
ncbi:hypothetical protein GCM10007358_14140 [Phocicoccus schoeneichii]|uniref:Uncharacterized protein n=1 Tax=Phocicoccus schoeneichii TaxID=1812261 RepID=A0A6V7R103_9BACL|nr:hypothetical protein GCM10007358_14140 [Jeotgalicoccus schoeneichii]CAD2070990.1 hypothetical protein JEOSCH030_00136 [Jeotgalicoccus schoeneichii]